MYTGALTSLCSTGNLIRPGGLSFLVPIKTPVWGNNRSRPCYTFITFTIMEWQRGSGIALFWDWKAWISCAILTYIL